MATSSKNLFIDAKLNPDGIGILVGGRDFRIKYPKKIWQQTPLSIKKVLLENLTFGNTNFLPLILGRNRLTYQINFPFFESFFFRNQIGDLIDCEKDDNVPPLTYLRHFHNLQYNFAYSESTLPNSSEIKKFRSKRPTAVVPFTFGKESLTVFAISREIDLKPVIFYCQEPTHIYEEKRKLKILKEFKKEFGVEFYFVKNGPGLFRYGTAFNQKKGTEIGWGPQITLLALMSIPVVLAHQASYLIFGSEHSNNDFEVRNGWQLNYSFDQTYGWTSQINNMIRLLTNNQCSVSGLLEPIEQLNIFYILQHRYPQFLKYLFSCDGENPLYQDSNWCHHCYKCYKIFLFAKCFDVDLEILGINEKAMLHNDFLSVYLSGTSDKDNDLDFALYILYKKGLKTDYVEVFKNKRLNRIKSWGWYIKYFSTLKDYINPPKQFKEKILKIFKEEVASFKKNLPL